METYILKHEKQWLQALDALALIFSTCSKRQYASIVVAKNKRVIGFGYNGSPPGVEHCSDGFCPRAKEMSSPGSAYDNCISQHAEAGALLWSDPGLRIGATLIVNGTPCMGCAKLIASSGVSRLVYREDLGYVQWPEASELLQKSSVTLIKG